MGSYLFGFSLHDYDLVNLVIRTDPTLWPHLMRLMAYLSEKSFSDQVVIRLHHTKPRLLRIFVPRIKPVFAHAVIRPWVKHWAEEGALERVHVRCVKRATYVYVPLSERRYNYLIANPSDQAVAAMQKTMISFLIKSGMPYSWLKRIVCFKE